MQRENESWSACDQPIREENGGKHPFKVITFNCIAHPFCASRFA